jgi:hypothetical protein
VRCRRTYILNKLGGIFERRIEESANGTVRMHNEERGLQKILCFNM